MYCVVLIVRYDDLATVYLFSFFFLLFCVLISSHSCDVLLRSIVVSAGLLRIFGREVAELPIVATSREHQGKVGSSLEKAMGHGPGC